MCREPEHCRWWLTLVVSFAALVACVPPASAVIIYSEFPYIALAVVAAATAIAYLTVRRHPTTGSGEGTTFSES